MKANVNSNFGMSLNYDFDSSMPIDIWVDNFQNLDNPTIEQFEASAGRRLLKKFFVQIEPNEIMGLNKRIIDNWNRFDYVLTYEQEVLDAIPNGVLFEYGTKWIHLDEYDLNKPKEFSVSTVCGHKTITENHKIRQKLWYKQNKISIPKKFFLSRLGGVENFGNNPILGERKEPLFDSMFHICIENVSKQNFFTEKLIDCLLCKTIPIYIGCPNIVEYFDVNGIIIVNSFNEAIEKCNELTPEFYESKKDVIEINRRLAMNWVDYNERLINKIKTLI
jgi:hypothetical protein